MPENLSVKGFSAISVLKHLKVFECCTFDHSDNSPYVKPEILKNTEDRTTGQNSKIFTFLN